MNIMKKSYGVAILTALSITLAGCNGESAQTASTSLLAEPAPGTPAPAPTTTPAPSPKPTTSPKPSPTPTPTTGKLYTGPAELEKYVVKFVDDAKRQGVDVVPHMKNLVIKIGDLSSYSSSTIGVCSSGNGKQNVTLSTKFWSSATEARRELLMHHELGHCVLDRRHRTTKLSNGNYASLMYPSIMPGATYTANYNYYQQELYAPTYRGWELPTEETVDDVCDESEIPEA